MKKSKIKRECPFSLFHENVGIIADDWSNRQKNAEKCQTKARKRPIIYFLRAAKL